MSTRSTRRRLGGKMLLAALLTFGGLGMVSGSPADAWCNPGASGSGLKDYGEEYYRSGTCDGDGYYAGYVRDNPSVQDGACAHIRLFDGSSWNTQAYACTSTWVSYSVFPDAPSFGARICKGTSSTICSIGGYSGA